MATCSQQLAQLQAQLLAAQQGYDTTALVSSYFFRNIPFN